MKILVTGATGGLGKLIVGKLLERDFDVIITSKDEKKAKKLPFFDKVTYINYDISSNSDIDLFKYFQEPDLLIHLAWENLNDFKTELHLTDTLNHHKAFIENLLKNGLSDITVTGTCYEYGLQEGVLIENLPSIPTMAYPKAKLLLQKFISEQQNKYTFNFKWIRIFYVFGEVEGRKNLYTLLNTAVENGEKMFNMSGGQQIRDFLSPKQIADICVKIALQNHTQGIINCCSGKPVKLVDYINDYLQQNNYQITLNLGYYPYPDYEPMETWGDVQKLNNAISIK